MRKYIKPDFTVVKFNAADEILTSSIIMQETPKTFDGAVSVGSASVQKDLTE